MKTHFAYPDKRNCRETRRTGLLVRRIGRAPRLGVSGSGWQDDGVSEEEMRKRLELLRVEHRDLDAAIDALGTAPQIDQLQIARLKKRKLKLKDQIALIADYLIPDIIA
jgi:hypothetical protein